MRTRSSVSSGQECSASRRWHATALTTASLARPKATKNESPCVSISWPPCSANGLAQDPLVIGERLAVAVAAELLEQLRRALDVGEQEGDGADGKFDRELTGASLASRSGSKQLRARAGRGAADCLPSFYEARAAGSRSSSSRSAAAIASGDGGQPGIRRSTGSTSSTGPTISSPLPRTLHPSAQSPSATTTPRLGHRRVCGQERLRILVVTGPVTSSTSAWRGEATIPIPNRWRSVYGLDVRISSCSHPLHDPASTCRTARLRPRSGRGSPIDRAEAAEVSEESQHQRSAQA